MRAMFSRDCCSANAHIHLAALGCETSGISQSSIESSSRSAHFFSYRRGKRVREGSAATMGRSGEKALAPFPDILECSSAHRENQTVISDLDGTLVRGRSSFPYFMLVAFEAGGVLRALNFLLFSPIVWVLYHFFSEAAGIKFMIFLTFTGLKIKRIETVCRAVLPKFYADDIHKVSWRVFSSFGKRYILTANPRVMVEVFGREFLGADEILGSEVQVWKGYCTGFVKASGILVGDNKMKALVEKFGDRVPDVGMGDRATDWPFMALCKEGYIVQAKKMEAMARSDLPRPIIFHDGRLVRRPTPLNALATLLWYPIGFILAVLRIAAGSLLPMSIVIHAFRALGVRVVVKGTPPSAPTKSGNKLGVLFVCSHRTLLDPIFLSAALGRPVSAVTYSISTLSEMLSPIRTVALSRNREQDAANIRKLLEEGDLAICPEGTTCREPFLLRFSALFAELTDQIVPVATYNRMSMFHGTTATGSKAMDPFFFFMNPSPVYEVTFLNKLPLELTCSGGKTSHEVANYIQRVLAGVLSFECTNLTRRDKYRVLAGSDGTVGPKRTTSLAPLATAGSWTKVNLERSWSSPVVLPVM